MEISAYQGQYREVPDDAPDDAEPRTVPAVPERVPVCYNDNSELTAVVEPGQNTFDFDLQSDAGEIIPVPGGEIPEEARETSRAAEDG